MQTFKIGHCGDAWKLRMVGDQMDVIDCIPTTSDGERTPIGLCADAPVLVICPVIEDGANAEEYQKQLAAWEEKIGHKLLDGKLYINFLYSNDILDVKVIYLDENDRERLREQKEISLDELKNLSRKSDNVLRSLRKKYKIKKRMPMEQNEFNALVSTLPDHVLLEIGKRTCGSDFAVRFYNNKNHKKFYKNRSELERAIRRMYAIGAFNHREIAVQIIQKHLPNTSQS